MIRTDGSSHGCAVLLGLALVTAVAPAGARNRSASQAWRDSFPVDKADLADHGRNPYFILEPGYRLYLEHGGEKLVVSVLNDTKVVDGVRTRVVEERETKGGQLQEVSRNYFAINKMNGDLYY